MTWDVPKKFKEIEVYITHNFATNIYKVITKPIKIPIGICNGLIIAKKWFVYKRIIIQY